MPGWIRSRLANRRTLRGVAALCVLLFSAYWASIFQYIAQYEPGAKAAHAVATVLVDAELPPGEWLTRSLGSRRAAIGRTHTMPDTSLAESQLFVIRNHEYPFGPSPGAWWFFKRANTHLVRAPHDLYRGLGVAPLHHPPTSISFIEYYDTEGLLANGGCIVLSFETPGDAYWSIKYMLPMYFAQLTGVGILFYSLYHIVAVSLIALMCAVGQRAMRRIRGAESVAAAPFSRVVALSALFAVPLPALFEIIWRTWAVYPGLYNNAHAGRDEPSITYLADNWQALFGTWLGAMILHALIVMSLRRVGSLNFGSEETTGLKKIRIWLAYRWWQLAMLVAAFAFFFTPLLMGVYGHLWSEGLS